MEGWRAWTLAVSQGTAASYRIIERQRMGFNNFGLIEGRWGNVLRHEKRCLSKVTYNNQIRAPPRASGQTNKLFIKMVRPLETAMNKNKYNSIILTLNIRRIINIFCFPYHLGNPPFIVKKRKKLGRTKERQWCSVG